LSTYFDLLIIPCPVWIAFDWTQKRLSIVLGFFLPTDFQVVMVNQPRIVVICVGIHSISLSNDMVHQVPDVSTTKQMDKVLASGQWT
jgi:hypothetical protein